MQASTPVDPDRLNNFPGRMPGGMGATLSAALVSVADRLGLCKAMAGGGFTRFRAPRRRRSIWYWKRVRDRARSVSRR